MKDDEHKPPLHLVPIIPLYEIAKVMQYGTEKYSAHNWRNDKDSTPHSRTYSSIMRHLMEYWSGEDIDPESNLPHLSHAASQLFMLMEYVYTAPDMDDRYKENKDESS
jgi:hypothetical protein